MAATTKPTTPAGHRATRLKNTRPVTGSGLPPGGQAVGTTR
jgi:hypothetical protein